MSDQSRWDALCDAIAAGDELAPADIAFIDDYRAEDAELEREAYRELLALGGPATVSAADRARAEATLAQVRGRIVRKRPAWPVVLVGGAVAVAAAALVWVAIPSPQLAESTQGNASLGISQDGSARSAEDGEVTLRHPNGQRAGDGALGTDPPEPAEADDVPPELLVIEEAEAEDTATTAPTEDEPASTRPSGRTQVSATAGELLAAARAHVASGDERRALSAYAVLQRRHPSSAEALAANVSIGELQLRRGRAKAALLAFDRYLGRGGGPLSEEAHWGRIRSLDRLGRIPARDAAIETLRSKHPKSVYVSRAASL